MNTEEYTAWQRFMKESRGHWTVDPIHDGVHRDLIVFRCKNNDSSRGVYVAIAGPQINAGEFSDAVPHLTDGFFTVDWSACFPDQIGQKYPPIRGNEKPGNAASAFAIERLGINFLLAITQGRDPYKTGR